MTTPATPADSDPAVPVHTGAVSWLPLWTTVLVVAWVTPPAVMARFFLTPTAGAWLLGVLFAIALEGAVATVWLAHPDRRVVDKAQYRLAEFVVVVVGLRLLTWGLGDFPDGAYWVRLLRAPLLVFDDTFLTFLLLGVLAWERTTTWTRLFVDMRLSNDEAFFYSLPRAARPENNDKPIYANRADLVTRFSRGWLISGAIMIFFAAGTTVDLPDLSLTTIRTLARLNLEPAVLAALLVYFVGGFMLLSRARFYMHYVRWLVADVTIAPQVRARWGRGTVVILAVIATVAAFLPIGSTFGGAVVLYSVVSLFYAVLNGLLLLLLVLISTVLSFFGRSGPPPEAPTLRPPPLLSPPESVDPARAGDAVQLAVGTLVWLAVIGGVVLAVLFFARQQGYLTDWRGVRRLLDDIWQRLRAWWAALRASAESIAQLIPRRSAESDPDDPAAPARWRYVRLNDLPPREQVRYFYLSTVRRAEEQGVPRRQSETPLEFAEDLKQQWPEAQGDVDQLTEAFLHAQYSPQPVTVTTVNPIKATWKRVRGSLRRRRRRAADPPPDGVAGDDSAES